MSCKETQELIHAYIDGELDVVKDVQLERHFEECETCRAEYEQQLNLRVLVHDGAAYFAAPDLLKQKVARQLREPRTSSSGRWRAIAAVVLFAGLSGLLIWSIISARSRSRADEMLAQEIVSSHVRSLLIDHLIDVPSSDTHTVKPWFNGKLDFAPEVKDFSAQGFPLIGGRLDYVGNKTVAALVYQKRKHPINLFVWTSPDAADRQEQQLSRQGYNLIHWIESGTTYWAISDVNNPDLHDFVQLVRQ